jgi:CRISPR type III-B/RAMP module-associated protein Cmr5
MPKLRDQDRAVAACNAVKRQISQWQVEKDKKKLTEYRQELQQLPSRILVSGLGQTLAFYASKSGPGDSSGIHSAIGHELARFLTGGKQVKTVGLLNDIIAGDASSYRRHTREALAYAEWLKRYAAALIPKPEKGGEGDR